MSVATVSRVFNGSAKVTDETRGRVLASARRLEYVPSAAARALVRRRSQLVGVVLFTGREHDAVPHPFFQEVLVGLKRAIGERGYDLLLFASDRPLGVGAGSYLRRALHHGVECVVVMGHSPDDPELRELLASPVPVVAIDLDVTGPRATNVMSDNVAGGRLAVQHLRALGHSRIATITGPRTHRAAADRLRGYLEGLDASPPPVYVRGGDFYLESGHAAMRALLALPEPPTAIFAASDLMALGAMRAAREAGLDVPRDLAVVGFDDIQVASLVHPSLTTVRQDKAGMGTAAANAGMDLIENPDASPQPITLPVELVVRDSA